MCRSLIYYKETPTQVFSCEYCEMFKNTYFEEHLGTAASKLSFQVLLILLTFTFLQ